MSGFLDFMGWFGWHVVTLPFFIGCGIGIALVTAKFVYETLNGLFK